MRSQLDDCSHKEESYQQNLKVRMYVHMSRCMHIRMYILTYVYDLVFYVHTYLCLLLQTTGICIMEHVSFLHFLVL